MNDACLLLSMARLYWDCDAERSLKVCWTEF